MIVDFKCDCGNDKCYNELSVRSGYVYFTNGKRTRAGYTSMP